MFGAEFREGYPLLFILVIGVVLRSGVGPAESLLNMTGHQNICAGIFGAALAVNISLNLVLIPTYGLMGAAYASAIAIGTEALLAGPDRLSPRRRSDVRPGPATEGARRIMLPQPMIEQAVPQAGSFMMSGLEGDVPARNPPRDQPPVPGRPPARHLSRRQRLRNSGRHRPRDRLRAGAERLLLAALPGACDAAARRAGRSPDDAAGRSLRRSRDPFPDAVFGRAVGLSARPRGDPRLVEQLQSLWHSDRRAARGLAHPRRPSLDARRSESRHAESACPARHHDGKPGDRDAARRRHRPRPAGAHHGIRAAAVPAKRQGRRRLFQGHAFLEHPPQLPPPAPQSRGDGGIRIRSRAQPDGCPLRDGGVPAAGKCRLEGTPEDVACRRAVPRGLRARGDQQSRRTRPRAHPCLQTRRARRRLADRAGPVRPCVDLEDDL